MKRTKTLLLSCLITVLIGLGLFFWLLPSKQTAKPVTIEKDSDSVVFVQPKAVVNDTTKDINVIRDYYRLYLKRANGQDISIHDERRFLTQTLIDKLCYCSGTNYLPLFPLEDNRDPRWSLDNLKLPCFAVYYIRYNEHNVSFFSSLEVLLLYRTCRVVGSHEWCCWFARMVRMAKHLAIGY